MSAVRTGVQALKLLEEVVATDSTMVDPDYFLGLYDWSRSDLRKRLWWVLFWLPGNRERGVARLERCRRESLFSRDGATLSLVDVYSHSGRFDEARGLLDELQAEFGDSRFVLWAEARFHEAREESQEAARVYRSLADSYRGEAHGRFNAAFCLMQAATLLESGGSGSAAADACRDLVEYHGGDTEERIVDICDDARRMLRRME
jgi:pentatricopeptide repeat protein